MEDEPMDLDPDLRAWYDHYAKMWLFKCPACGRWKTQYSYPRQGNSMSGYAPVCKPCVREKRLETERAASHKSL
jgi:hypothetical protein